MIPVSATILAAFVLLGGCSTEAQRRAAENEKIEQQAVQEMKRICALPSAEREAEIKRIKADSGIIIECGNQ